MIFLNSTKNLPKLHGTEASVWDISRRRAKKVVFWDKQGSLSNEITESMTYTQIKLFEKREIYAR